MSPLRNLLALLSLLPILTLANKEYNGKECLAWPNSTVWKEELSDVLTANAALHGPFPEGYYMDSCEGLGSDAFAISRAGSGICMHAHACQREFCRKEFDFDLPAYIVEAKQASDIQAALNFSKTHDVQVTVKTTGHSYHGASTAKDSLLIWMQNFEKNGTIYDNYTSCDGAKTYHAVVAVNGGETWNDVIEAVGPNYHAVTGGGRTVSAAGGWLQGSGLSFTSRKYGLGVDQAVQFEAVLADGTMVTANACENTDLYWALRGGGGGTFGVVTNVLYELHPVSPVIVTNWYIEGFENAPDQGAAAVPAWLKYWIKVSPDLDPRIGGFFGTNGVHIVFMGTLQEAKAAYLDAFDLWYYSELLPISQFIPDLYGALPPSVVTGPVADWYTYKGGADAYNNPDATDPTGDSYDGAEYIAARLIPASFLREKPDEMLNLLVGIVSTPGGYLGPVNYILGGNIQNVGDNETSVSPALRAAAWNLFVDPASVPKLFELLPNSVTGACFNHHSPVEPDWRNSLWGTQYDRLLELKNKYDPDRVFNCWHCVGYTGLENPVLEDGPSSEAGHISSIFECVVKNETDTGGGSNDDNTTDTGGGDDTSGCNNALRSFATLIAALSISSIILF
mmetsp:Transcript_2860/g.6726  ORF Transcript_2860/g.6726 Transcript_2860/m.6726 type:complete len:621 (-) Transcript_2860:68-1930(-)|eukprot:CAMPEP_0113621950 /NCGR_PEP_ID=MMETSP0017_2-20120614/11234_1 /TAXON_ID=2856 /ORGANISM="Cylindrotheca closterium" /LENGTH=620 /DNA_ID=CAMNT_0000531741 /DNA_START=70 /DNA_END=1932 /DNA_ORIENTATION=+ /assembly_acc=CAM_ASM_000147